MTDYFFDPAVDESGGGAEAIDYIDGSVVYEGNAIFLCNKSTGRFSVWMADIDLALDEEAGGVIKPDSNAGDKRYRKIFDGGRIVLPSSNVDQTDDSIMGTLAWHKTAIGTSRQKVKFLSGFTYLISDDFDCGAYVDLDIEPGALIQPAASKSLTVYSPANILAAPNQQIIDTTNNSTNPMLFTNPGEVNCEWWGTDDVALQAAISSRASGGQKVWVNGNIDVDAQVTSEFYTKVIGRGWANSKITVTTGGQLYLSGSTDSRNVVFEDLWIYSADTSLDLIQIASGYEVSFINCYIQGGGKSIRIDEGLRIIFDRSKIANDGGILLER